MDPLLLCHHNNNMRLRNAVCWLYSVWNSNQCHEASFIIKLASKKHSPMVLASKPRSVHLVPWSFRLLLQIICFCFAAGGLCRRPLQSLTLAFRLPWGLWECPEILHTHTHTSARHLLVARSRVYFQISNIMKLLPPLFEYAFGLDRCYRYRWWSPKYQHSWKSNAWTQIQIQTKLNVSFPWPRHAKHLATTACLFWRIVLAFHQRSSVNILQPSFLTQTSFYFLCSITKMLERTVDLLFTRVKKLPWYIASDTNTRSPWIQPLEFSPKFRDSLKDFVSSGTRSKRIKLHHFHHYSHFHKYLTTWSHCHCPC